MTLSVKMPPMSIFTDILLSFRVAFFLTRGWKMPPIRYFRLYSPTRDLSSLECHKLSRMDETITSRLHSKLTLTSSSCYSSTTL